MTQSRIAGLGRMGVWIVAGCSATAPVPDQNDAGLSMSAEDARAVRRRLREAPPALPVLARRTSALEGISGVAASSPGAPLFPRSGLDTSPALPLVPTLAPAGPPTFLLRNPITPMPDRSGRYVMRRSDSATFFTPTGFTWSLSAPAKPVDRDAMMPRHEPVERKGWGLSMTLVGAREGSLVAEQPAPAKVNHYVGLPSAWATELPTFERLAWEDVYPGIDMVAEPARGGIAYKFVLSPGAKVADVKLRWEGATALKVVNDGRGLDVETGIGKLTVRGLRAFAVHGQQRTELPARQVVTGSDVGVEVDGWDGSVPLVIDPSIAWSSYLGGAGPLGGTDQGSGIAVDGSGNVFVTGMTQSTDFPTTGGFDTILGGGNDTFVTKVSAAGGLLWSSYLGGAGSENGAGVVVDGSGNAFVTGSTTSSDFPTSAGFDTTLGGSQDAFVTKVSGAGGLLWSSFLGGADVDVANGIAVDGSGNVFVTGSTLSSDFPTTGGFDATFGAGTYEDAFVTKVSGAGGLLWSSYLGGASVDRGYSIAVDGGGDAYLAGYTNSTDFPTSGGFDTTLAVSDAFVTKVSGAGVLLWSSYLGGASGEYATSIAVDASGNAFVTGFTFSTDFPTTGGFDTTYGGLNTDAFVTKVSASGTLLWSSYLGGASNEEGHGIAVDASGNAIVTGWTKSSDFLTTGGFDTTFGGGTCTGAYPQICADAFVTKVSGAGGLLWSSFLGGAKIDEGFAIAADVSGNIFVTGRTQSTDFPTSGGFDTTYGGNPYDAFVTKLTALGSGSPCTSAAMCLLSCSDGVCCDKPCGGPCEACTAAKKGSGTNGTCGPIANGTDPDTECAAQACSSSLITKAQVCNGAGACRGDGTISCGLYACVGTGCQTSCAADTACAASAFCSGTTCTADFDVGSPCVRNAQCKTDACADGVCCDRACTGPCEACTATRKGSGTDGTCSNVAAGTDPRDRCAADSSPGSCASDGMCDGSGTCRLYRLKGTPCGVTACTSGTVAGKTCSGAGTCDTAATPCAPYRCDASGTACATSCTANADCDGAYCSSKGTCVASLPNGEKCSGAKECTSGICIDGYCCNAACGGSCEACDAKGAEGVCSPIAGAPHGGRAACATDSKECAGTCEGKVGTCTYPDAAKLCGSGCSDAKIARCDGRGTCGAPASCPDFFKCADGTTCRTTCTTDSHCTIGYRCESGKCVAASAKCSDDRKQSIPVGGTPTDCDPYLCTVKTGLCAQLCESAADCALGYECGSDRTCAKPATVVEPGCGCSTPGSRETEWRGGCFAIAIAAWAVRRRRRQGT